MKIQFIDGNVFKLPDISYERFENSEFFKEGSSDTEYASYLRENDMHEITSFNAESLRECVIVVEDYSGRKITLKVISDIDE
jgi:hypothetical protein